MKKPARQRRATAGRSPRRRGDRRGHARRSLRRARPPRGRRAGWSPRLRSATPSASSAFTLDGKPARRARRAASTAGFFEGRSSLRKRQPLRYRAAQRRRRLVLSPTPIRFGPVLGPMDDYYIAEGTHLRLFDKLGAHLDRRMRASTASISPSGRRTPGASRWSATSTTGTAAAIRCASASTPASGRSSFPTSARATLYKYEIIGARRRAAAAEGRPLRLRAPSCGRRPPRSSRRRSTIDWSDDGASRAWAQGRPAPRRRCRSTRCISAPGSARDDGTLPDLGRARRPADPLCRRDWASPISSSCRSPSIRSIRPGATSRPASTRRRARFGDPARLRALRRRRPPRRHRRHPRLGAGAFPDRRARPGAASTAPRSTSTPIRARASIPTGTPRSTISAAREVVDLPDQQRALLARALPHRRPARRCGRLDALPRLFAQGRRMDAQRGRRPREPRGDRLPAGA